MALDAGVDFPLLGATLSINDGQAQRVVDKIHLLTPDGLAGARVGVLGLAFKAGTDDVRDSPALEIVGRLLAAGVHVVAHDPAVPTDATLCHPRLAAAVDAGLRTTLDRYEPARDADVLVIATEWSEYRDLDPDKVAELMAHPAIVDTRNLLNRESFLRHGFRFLGTGR
jgi:UDPglucose 6-dehydrogenase